MASIDKLANGRYKARWRDYPSGPTRSQTFDRKVDAERHLTGVEHAKLTGVYASPAAGKRTFKSYAEEWRKQQVWRPGSAARVEGALRLHVYPEIGDMPLSNIKTSTLQAMVKTFVDKDMAASTVEGTYRYAVAVLRSAVTDRLIAVSPAQGVKLPKVERKQVVPLAMEQVEALAEAMPAKMRGLVLFAAGSGLRQGECFGLTVDRVDFLRRTVRVDRQMVQPPGGGEPAFGPTKTVASNRTVPLSETTINMLASHVEQYGVGPDDLLFVNRYGRPIQRSHFGMTWSDARDRARVSAARFHDLRHHFASVLIGAGCSIKAVQNALGHATAAETLDTYSHLWPDDEDRIRRAVDEAWRDRAVSSLCPADTA